MPTIEETLEGAVRYIQRLMESPCPFCGGTKERTDYVEVSLPCGFCDGTGSRELRGAKEPCGLCSGTGRYMRLQPTQGPCECGDGVSRLGRHDPLIVAAVLNSCISGMYQTRADANFDRMNRILDWAMRYCRDNAEIAMARAKDDPNAIEEAIRRVQHAGRFTPADVGAKLVGGALTPEELDALLAEDSEPT